MKQGIMIGFIIVSNIVGVGLASGKELVSIFLHNGTVSWWVPIMVGSCVCAISIAILTMASKMLRVYKNKVVNVNQHVLGKWSVVGDVFSVINSFVSLGIIVATLNLIGGRYGLIVGLIGIMISGIIASGGIGRISTVCSVVVPIVLTILMSSYIFGIKWDSLNFNNSALWAVHIGDAWESILYVLINLYISINAIAKFRTVNKKQILTAGVVGGGIIAFIVGLECIAINSDSSLLDGNFVLIEIASHMGIISQIMIIGLLIGCAIMSMTAGFFNANEWIASFIDSKFLRWLLVVLIGFMISLLGWNIILDWIYPWIGLVCMAFFGLIFIDITKKANITKQVNIVKKIENNNPATDNQ